MLLTTEKLLLLLIFLNEKTKFHIKTSGLGYISYKGINVD
jgi:hypothetical protein